MPLGVGGPYRLLGHNCGAKRMLIERLLGARCPLCGGELDAPGVCLSCRARLHSRRRHNLIFLGSYREMRGAVRTLKFKGGYRTVDPLAQSLAAGVREAGWPVEAVTAVPTVWWRRLRRGYNPAELLGKRIAKLLHLPYERVVGRRYSQSQTRRRREDRVNIRPGTFYLLGEIEYGSWLLVDDVWTTGATFKAVERVLRAGGATAVFGAVLAAPEYKGW